jgi:hypothetical protein
LIHRIYPYQSKPADITPQSSALACPQYDLTQGQGQGAVVQNGQALQSGNNAG